MPSARTAVSSVRFSRGRQAGPQVGERVGEAGPAVDLLEKVGDPDPGQRAVEQVRERERLLGRARLERGHATAGRP